MNPPPPRCYVPLGVVEIREATPAEHPLIGDLARRIWHASFRDLITTAQIDYMLNLRYTPEAMARAVSAEGLTYELLRVDGEPLGYLAHGPGPGPGEYKLQQLYIHPAWQGRGLGARLIEHAASAARTRGAHTLVLTVNRRNDRARALYERHGFRIREAAVFDLGHGFVMDDFVMAKPLAE